jgi:hypothetical protein
MTFKESKLGKMIGHDLSKLVKTYIAAGVDEDYTTPELNH